MCHVFFKEDRTFISYFCIISSRVVAMSSLSLSLLIPCGSECGEGALGNRGSILDPRKHQVRMLRGRMFFDGLLRAWTPISNLSFHVVHIAVEESQYIGSAQVEGRVWSPSGMLNFEFEKADRQWLIGADNVSGS